MLKGKPQTVLKKSSRLLFESGIPIFTVSGYCFTTQNILSPIASSALSLRQLLILNY